MYIDISKYDLSFFNLYVIMGISLLEKLENDEIRRASVVKITEVIRETRLRWYGYVLRMDGKKEVKRSWEEPVRGRISRGRQRIDGGIRQKKIWRRDLVEDAVDSRQWRTRIRQPTP